MKQIIVYWTFIGLRLHVVQFEIDVLLQQEHGVTAGVPRELVLLTLYHIQITTLCTYINKITPLPRRGRQILPLAHLSSSHFSNYT